MPTPFFLPAQLLCEGTALIRARNWLHWKRKKKTTLCEEIKSKRCFFFKQDQFPNVTESDPTSSHADISDGRKKLWGRGNTLSSLNSRPVLCLMKSQPEERLCCAVFLLPLSSFPSELLSPHQCHDYIQPGMHILICSVYIKESWNQWLSETHLTSGRTANFLLQCCRLFNLTVLKKEKWAYVKKCFVMGTPGTTFLSHPLTEP